MACQPSVCMRMHNTKYCSLDLYNIPEVIYKLLVGVPALRAGCGMLNMIALLVLSHASMST